MYTGLKALTLALIDKSEGVYQIANMTKLFYNLNKLYYCHIRRQQHYNHYLNQVANNI